MNIFYISHDPVEIAKWQVDRHCIKMPTEQTQLLCNAHRILDGKQKVVKINGRNKKIWEFDDERNDFLHKTSHYNHPCSIWTRSSDSNYLWLYQLYLELLKEFSYRYGKTHSCERFVEFLKNPPNNIPKGNFTEPPLAMPDVYKVPNDAVASYRKLYIYGKRHLANWSGKVNGRPIPEWYK